MCVATSIPKQGEDLEDYATSCVGFLLNQLVATFAPAQVIKTNQTLQSYRDRRLKFRDSDFKTNISQSSRLKIKSSKDRSRLKQ